MHEYTMFLLKVQQRISIIHFEIEVFKIENDATFSYMSIKVKLCLSVPTFVYSRLTGIFQPLESASSDVIRRGKE